LEHKVENAKIYGLGKLSTGKSLNKKMLRVNGLKSILESHKKFYSEQRERVKQISLVGLQLNVHWYMWHNPIKRLETSEVAPGKDMKHVLTAALTGWL